jgi:heme/copper-type cytochrome/quinol oxidase subunit 2
MSNRSWFFASQGKQQGPYPEAQLRDFIANGTVTAETLVWTEGMAGWQKAGDIPGLLSGAAGSPVVPGAGAVPGSGAPAAGPLSVDFGIWDFIWRTLVLLIGLVLVIPVPWVIVMYCRWIVSCTHVPDRPNLTFSGRPITVLWWYFGAILLSICLALAGIRYLNALMIFVQFGLYWLAIRWFVANIASNGQPLRLGFSGSYWGYLGWNILFALSIFTIIGWAWVYTAQIRWMCRHIEGTRRDVVFNATGLAFLWRSIVATLPCLLIIPIPWMYRWFTRWLVSQIVLAERTAYANA